MRTFGLQNVGLRQTGHLAFTTRRCGPSLRYGRCKSQIQAEGDEKKKVDQEINELKQSLVDSSPRPEKLQGEGKKEEGKGLAIVTGAISVAIGVLYLVGVSLLNNSRGSSLIPPPSEAFGWIGLHLWL